MLAIRTKGKSGTATATCELVEGSEFKLTVDKVPYDIHQSKIMSEKLEEIVRIIGREHLKDLEINVATDMAKGAHVAVIYAARQAICRAVTSFYASMNEMVRQRIETVLKNFDRTCLVTDVRRKEPKKYGGPGARARYQKSYR